MEDKNEVRQTIERELTSDNSEVRSEYLQHFSAEVSKFTEAMSVAFLKWREFDSEVKDNERRRINRVTH